MPIILNELYAAPIPEKQSEPKRPVQLKGHVDYHRRTRPLQSGEGQGSHPIGSFRQHGKSKRGPNGRLTHRAVEKRMLDRVVAREMERRRFSE